ncbi:MAG: hypothetical protein DRG20_03935 [Deltaproteobacteria bacterium]|nr:MAG: hypothetical protein DRG20_03935 [Deltaproteobacteria bacterium]
MQNRIWKYFIASLFIHGLIFFFLYKPTVFTAVREYVGKVTIGEEKKAKKKSVKKEVKKKSKEKKEVKKQQKPKKKEEELKIVQRRRRVKEEEQFLVVPAKRRARMEENPLEILAVKRRRSSVEEEQLSFGAGPRRRGPVEEEEIALGSPVGRRDVSEEEFDITVGEVSREDVEEEEGFADVIISSGRGASVREIEEVEVPLGSFTGVSGGVRRAGVGGGGEEEEELVTFAGTPGGGSIRRAGGEGEEGELGSLISSEGISVRKRRRRTAGAGGGGLFGPSVTMSKSIEDRLIKKFDPVYPQEAVRRRIEGVVILEVEVDANGKVHIISVSGPHPILEKAAKEAVLKWTFRPGPPVRGKITIRFEII